MLITDEELDALHRRLTREVIDVCDKCGGTGHLVVEPEPGDDEIRTRRCSCHRRVNHTVRLAEAEVPREFWQVDELRLDSNHDRQVEVLAYCDNLEAARGHGLGFLFSGTNGVGKTACACLILSRAIREGYTAFYVTFHELLALIRRGRRDSSIQDRVDRACRRDFMVLDELGKEFRRDEADPYVTSELDALLRARRSALLPTVLVTNLAPDEVGSVYGRSIDSLVSDRTRALLFRPGDFRKRREASAEWSRMLKG